MIRPFVLSGVLAAISASGLAQDPDFSAELPRIPATEPADAPVTFDVRPPFNIELVAAEPLVMDPVAMAFDEDGRLYVAEMRDYSEQNRDYLGVIRRLVDTNGDGRFDDSTVFAKELSWPTAVFPWAGGVFVGAPPHLFYLKDTNGDGIADLRKTIYTGFSRSNVQGMMNSLRWGLDNRVHGAGSTAGGSILFTGDPEREPVELGRHDFAFDPRTFAFAVTTASSQHGMCFDNWGHKFVCSNSDHIQQVMYDDRLVARNPYLKAPGGAVSIAADGPQAPVFRTSQVEPWRIVRTRLRVAGLAPGPIEHGGKVSGYFSSATGVTIYRGDTWPAEWHGTAIIGDVGSNLIHRKKLKTQELPFVAERVDDNTEFVTSTDTWFRPVQFENGPDGALYVADFYRETIEHPASLPESIKKHLDLKSRGRGRIWRIIPENFTHRPAPKLSEAATADLVPLLAHPNAWHRETAARLIYERQDKSIVSTLERLARSTGPPADKPGARGRDVAALARLHAVHALDGLGSLPNELLAAALLDSHARVREAALRLALPRVQHSPVIRERLFALAEEVQEDVWVRYHLTFALGEITARKDAPKAEVDRAVEALGTLLLGDPDNGWQHLAALSSLSGHEARVLASYPETPSSAWTDLAAIVARRGKPEELPLVADRLERDPTSAVAKAALGAWIANPTPAVRNALNEASRPKLQALIADRLAAAKTAAIAPDSSPAERLAAVATLRLAPFETAAEAFETLAEGRQPPAVQRAGIDLLREHDTSAAADLLIAAWPGFSPSVRDAAAEALTATAASATRLLDAIEGDSFDPATLPQPKRQLLREHPDAAIRERAITLLADTALAKREEVVAAYRPALELSGDPAKGHALFKQHCAVCHRAGTEGHEVGPNLSAIKARGAEFILLNLFDPSREVNPQFVEYTAVTVDGVVKTGLIASESPTAVTLKRSEGLTETLLRLDIDSLQSTGRSLMPDGFEKQLDQQATADLIAYLMSLE